MLSFKFGTETISIEEIVSPATTIEKTLNTLATKEMLQYRELYKKSSPQLSNVAAIVEKLGQQAIDNGINVAIDSLLENGVFDYDLFRFKSLSPQLVLLNRDVFLEQMQGLELIYQNEQLSQANRDAQRAGRGRWTGGGFGVKGAIKGAVTAGALNAVTDAFRGIGDFSKDAEKSAEFLEKKNAYIHSALFVDSIANDISQCIRYEIKEILFSILKENVPDFFVQRDYHQKTNALFNNLPRMTPNQQIKALAQAIQLEPHNWKFIQYAYDHQEELRIEKNEIDAIAKICDENNFVKAENVSVGFPAFCFDDIVPIPFNQEKYSAAASEIPKDLKGYSLAKACLSNAIRYSLIDTDLFVLSQNIDEKEMAYRALFCCATWDLSAAFDAKQASEIISSAKYTCEEKYGIIFAVLNKYHLIEGTEEDFYISPGIVSTLKGRILAKDKVYLFVTGIVTRAKIMYCREATVASYKTGIEYLCELCAKEAKSDGGMSIGAPIDGTTKQVENLRKSCNIPENDEIYIMGDSTLFENGKKGFALTTSGFFHNINKEPVFWNWTTFSEKKIDATIERKLIVGDMEYVTASNDLLFPALKILCSMQKEILREQCSDTENENSLGQENQNIKDTMFCTSCGKKIPRSAKFCTFCGASTNYKEE